MIWFDLSWSDTWIISKYKNLLDCYDKLMTRVQTNGVGDAICENVLQILDIDAPKPRFWGAQISFYWQGHRKMIRQLVRSEGMSSYVDPRIARIQQIVCANGHLAPKVDKHLVPRHSDLWKSFRNPDTYSSRSLILEDKIKFYPAGHRKTATATTNSIL